MEWKQKERGRKAGVKIRAVGRGETYEGGERVRGGSVKESESERHSGEQESGRKKRERTWRRGGRVFLSSCALSQRGQ